MSEVAVRDSSVPPAYCRGLFGISSLEKEGIRIGVGRSLTKLVITLPGTGFLNFSSLQIVDPEGREVPAASVRQIDHSPLEKNGKNWHWQDDPLAKKGYHSDFGEDRFYSISFNAELSVGEVLLKNRSGRWGVRLLPVAVNGYHGQNTVFSWKNCSRQRLEDTLCKVRSVIAELSCTDGAEAKMLIRSLDSFVGHGFDDIANATEPAIIAFTAMAAAANEHCKKLARNRDFRGWRLLELLIDRYPEQPWVAQNTEMLSTYFALRLLSGGLGDGFAGVLASWNGYFAKPEELIELERCVADRYEQLGGIGRPSISRHGWFVSNLSLNSAAALKGTAQIAEQLGRQGFRPWLCYGTLLGAVRDGGFIPYDDDIDLAVEVSESDAQDLEGTMNRLVGALKQIGHKCSYDGELEIVQIDCPGVPKVGIDIFPAIKESSGHDGLYKMKHASMRWRFLSKEILFPLSQVSLGGVQFAAPRLAELFLEWRYGETWKIPQKYFEMDWIFAR